MNDLFFEGGVVARGPVDDGQAEFECEKNWILAHVGQSFPFLCDRLDHLVAYLLDTLNAEASVAEAHRLAEEQEIANGGGIECGCCFGEYVWVSWQHLYNTRQVKGSELTVQGRMFQCQEGHLFCKECSTQHAETRLGDQEHVSTFFAPSPLSVADHEDHNVHGYLRM